MLLHRRNLNHSHLKLQSQISQNQWRQVNSQVTGPCSMEDYKFYFWRTILNMTCEKENTVWKIRKTVRTQNDFILTSWGIRGRERRENRIRFSRFCLFGLYQQNKIRKVSRWSIADWSLVTTTMMKNKRPASSLVLQNLSGEGENGRLSRDTPNGRSL